MKLIINLLIIIALNATASMAQKKISEDIKYYLKKNKFQLCLYELSFCTKEIMPMLENDTLSRKYLKKSLSQSFDSRLDKVELFINYKQSQVLFDSLAILKYQKIYPKAYTFVMNLKKTIPIINENFGDYVQPFVKSIKYPDQVDPICNFYLVYYNEEKPFDEILKNNEALYYFNQWLKYGFIEFRGYSQKTTPQNEISDRIMLRIKINHQNQKNELLKSTLTIIKKLQDS